VGDKNHGTLARVLTLRNESCYETVGDICDGNRQTLWTFPLRLIPIDHDARIGYVMPQHSFIDQPVRVFCAMSPCVDRMCSYSMDGDNTVGSSLACVVIHHGRRNITQLDCIFGAAGCSEIGCDPEPSAMIRPVLRPRTVCLIECQSLWPSWSRYNDDTVCEGACTSRSATTLQDFVSIADELAAPTYRRRNSNLSTR
jgi:hypothetical protein